MGAFFMFVVTRSKIRFSLEGNFHHDRQASVSDVDQFKTKIRSVDLIEPGTDITQTYSLHSKPIAV
jgi:hypothetical protein